MVDIGNTRTKAVLFHGGRITRHSTADRPEELDLGALTDGRGLDGVALASVGHPSEEVRALFSALAPVQVITGTSPTPVDVAYRTPETLGVDRLANAVAIALLFPGRSMLAVDLGTCITYDLVRPREGFIGGAITPGPRMRSRAMHAYSARLPLTDPDPRAPMVGRDTRECLATGVFHGVVHEIAGIVSDLRQQAPDLGVVLTGGAALPFVHALKSGIFADPFLTLRGLYAIHLHNLVP